MTKAMMISGYDEKNDDSNDRGNDFDCGVHEQ